MNERKKISEIVYITWANKCEFLLYLAGSTPNFANGFSSDIPVSAMTSMLHENNLSKNIYLINNILFVM